jgi:hypothetical protein
VLVSGRPLPIPWATEQLPAVVFTPPGGTEGGRTLAERLDDYTRGPYRPSFEATVESVDTLSTPQNGGTDLRVTVRLRNEGETGLDSVEVVVHCGRTERSLVFGNVPAQGNRIGTVVCPQATTPRAVVATWVEA